MVRWHVARRWRRGDTRVASRRVDGVEMEETPRHTCVVVVREPEHTSCSPSLSGRMRSNSGREHMSVTVASPSRVIFGSTRRRFETSDESFGG